MFASLVRSTISEIRQKSPVLRADLHSRFDTVQFPTRGIVAAALAAMAADPQLLAGVDRTYLADLAGTSGVVDLVRGEAGDEAADTVAGWAAAGR